MSYTFSQEEEREIENIVILKKELDEISKVQKRFLFYWLSMVCSEKG